MSKLSYIEEKGIWSADGLGLEFVDMQAPLYVWAPAPKGYYEVPNLICTSKTGAEELGHGKAVVHEAKHLGQVLQEVKGSGLKQRVLTSGEWYQIRMKFKATVPGMENRMVTGQTERTSTILDYDHGQRRGKITPYFDGLFIQNVIPDGDGGFAQDSDKILDGDVWRMPLPLKGGFVYRMPKIFDPFIDTIYGMEEARKKVPKNAYIWIGREPKGLHNIVRGCCGVGGIADRRVRVVGGIDPLETHRNMAFRTGISIDEDKLNKLKNKE